MEFQSWDWCIFRISFPIQFTQVEEAIHWKLHLNNINKDNGIEIPQAWMPMTFEVQLNIFQQNEATELIILEIFLQKLEQHFS